MSFYCSTLFYASHLLSPGIQIKSSLAAPAVGLVTPQTTFQFVDSAIIDSLVVEYKLTVLSFFSSQFIFLEYTDSSNQRDFFSSRLTRAENMSIQISRIRVTPKKTSEQEQAFFLQCSSLFLRASVSSLLLNSLCCNH